jgi:hypothetical protein
LIAKNKDFEQKGEEEMKEIKSVNDLVVVPVSYFNGMEKELQKILNKVDIHDMDVMEQVLHMRKWLKTKTVYEETKRLYPNLRLENIHLLLPQEESDERGLEYGTQTTKN